METIERLNKIEGQKVSAFLSGRMYYFRYLAEPTNAYFDRFPLIFVTKKRGRLLEGINFHYINLKYRTELFELMRPFFDTDEIEENTRLRVKSFRKLILESRKFRHARVALHRYKIENVRSKIIMLSPASWNSVILEDAEKFVTGAGGRMNVKKVFRDSLIKSKGKK